MVVELKTGYLKFDIYSMYILEKYIYYSSGALILFRSSLLITFTCSLQYQVDSDDINNNNYYYYYRKENKGKIRRRSIR